MIRSSSHSLKFSNKGKLEQLETFIENYRCMVKKFVNILWQEQSNNKFLDNNQCKIIKTNVTQDSRIRQCAAKQACSMVKSALTKHHKRLFKLKELQQENKNTKYLQRKIDLNKPVKQMQIILI